MGATSGRTTLNGEGLQHQDGQSHLFLSTVPSCISYDPAFAYELALIVQDGLDRMFQKNQEIFYYISVYNENYPMPPMPEGVEEGILRGIYRLRKSGKRKFNGSAHILAAGPSVIQAMEAAEILEDHYGIATHIWSVTSFTELRRDALRSERQRMLHPTKNQRSYLEKTLEKEQGVFVGVSDHVRSVPDGIARWIPGPYYSVGTDGFGRSDTRSSLRNFFEVDAAHIAFYALSGLFRKGDVSKDTVLRAMDELKIDTGTQDPMDR